jgi:hypothetical protein
MDQRVIDARIGDVLDDGLAGIEASLAPSPTAGGFGW